MRIWIQEKKERKNVYFLNTAVYIYDNLFNCDHVLIRVYVYIQYHME
jgi:hypothetical protein